MNPIPAMQSVIRRFLVAGRQRWRRPGIAACCAMPVLLLAGAILAGAQEPDGSAQTNEIPAAQVLSQLNELAREVDPSQAEDMPLPNDLAPTNGLPSSDSSASSMGQTGKVERAGASGRPQGDDRRARGRRSYRSKSDQRGASGTGSDLSREGDGGQANGGNRSTNGPVSLDYSAFQIIVDRNIFDPNRYPRRPGAPRVASKPKNVDSLSLVGTMSYEKGTFAFFDGTSSDYKKALKLTDSIAGYKVTNIAPNAVKLVSGTNELELRVGAQLRREEDGPWFLAGGPSSYAPTPGSASTSGGATATTGSSAVSGADSEIIKRLMQRRGKE